MEFFRIQRVIPFMKHALVFNIISLITFLLAVLFLATRGLNLGVDFRGGTVIEIAYSHPADLVRVRSALDKTRAFGDKVNAFLTSHGSAPLDEAVPGLSLLRRPDKARRFPAWCISPCDM